MELEEGETRSNRCTEVLHNQDGQVRPNDLPPFQAYPTGDTHGQSLFDEVGNNLVTVLYRGPARRWWTRHLTPEGPSLTSRAF